MATLAATTAEKVRLMKAPYRCVVKIHRVPAITDSGGATPDLTADDFLLWIKDGRTSATGAGGTTTAQGTSPIHVSAVALKTSLRTGLEKTRGPGAARQPSGNWRLYDVGASRWSGLIPDSQVVFA